MARVRVIHWNEEEAKALLECVRAAGHEAVYAHGTGPRMVQMTRKPPLAEAIVIDLTRLPSHGREVGVALRNSKALRATPIIFVDGEGEKLEKTRERVPAAYFCSRAQLAGTLKKAMREAASKGEFPRATPQMDLYRSRFTYEKLGVKPGSTLGVIDPPRDYLAALGPLPDGVEVVENPDAPQTVTLWFSYELQTYLDSLRRMRSMADRTRLWVAWRKGAKNGLTQNAVRECAREVGLVDYKICAIDGNWSGMAFVRKRA